MTKDQYFEMCETLGTEPVDSEIPIEMQDFHQDVQTAFSVYYMLRDIWDTMGGGYMGKDMSNIFDFLDLYSVDRSEYLFFIGFIRTMDSVRSKQISEKLKAKEASSKKA